MIALGTTLDYDVPKNSKFVDPYEMNKNYEGKNRPDRFSWLMKAVIDVENKCYVCDFQKNSMIFKKEYF